MKLSNTDREPQTDTKYEDIEDTKRQSKWWIEDGILEPQMHKRSMEMNSVKRKTNRQKKPTET